MATTSIRRRIVTGVVGAAMAGMAAPALLFLGAGSAGAVTGIGEHPAATNTTQRAPGHVSIYVQPPVVSAPHVWGPYDSVVPIISD